VGIVVSISGVLPHPSKYVPGRESKNLGKEWAKVQRKSNTTTREAGKEELNPSGEKSAIGRPERRKREEDVGEHRWKNGLAKKGAEKPKKKTRLRVEALGKND